MLWLSVIGGAVPYLSAATSGVRVGFGSSYGALNPQPANVVSQGTEIVLLDWRASTGQLRLNLTGDHTTWLTGKTLTIGNNSYAVSASTVFEYDAPNTVVNWSDTSTTVIADGRGYQIGVA